MTQIFKARLGAVGGRIAIPEQTLHCAALCMIPTCGCCSFRTSGIETGCLGTSRLLPLGDGRKEAELDHLLLLMPEAGWYIMKRFIYLRALNFKSIIPTSVWLLWGPHVTQWMASLPENMWHSRFFHVEEQKTRGKEREVEKPGLHFCKNLLARTSQNLVRTTWIPCKDSTLSNDLKAYQQALPLHNPHHLLYHPCQSPLPTHKLLGNRSHSNHRTHLSGKL